MCRDSVAGGVCRRLQAVSLVEGVCTGAVPVRNLAQMVVRDPSASFVGRSGGEGVEQAKDGQGMHFGSELKGEGVEALRVLVLLAVVLEGAVCVMGVFALDLCVMGGCSAGAYTEGDG